MLTRELQERFVLLKFKNALHCDQSKFHPTLSRNKDKDNEMARLTVRVSFFSPLAKRKKKKKKERKKEGMSSVTSRAEVMGSYR